MKSAHAKKLGIANDQHIFWLMKYAYSIWRSNNEIASKDFVWHTSHVHYMDGSE